MRHHHPARLLCIGLLSALLQLAVPQLHGQLIWDNGPYYNSVGTGAGCANESVLRNLSQGMAVVAYSVNVLNSTRLTDDFEITGCRVRIDSIVFFGYQVNSGLTSTFTELNWRIWDGQPGLVGSSVILGDSLTNRLLASRWSGAYRVWENNQGNDARPIMRIVADMGGAILTTGDYWIDWGSVANLGTCWYAPRTPAGQANTGNALQYNSVEWRPLRDVTGTNETQGLPFMIYGQTLDLVADAGSNRSICIGGNTVLGGSPTVSGASGPWTLVWSPSTGLSSTTSPNPIASPTANSSYFLTATDSTGCTVMDTVAVVLGANSANLLPGDTSICNGSLLALDPGPANGYQWSNGATTQTQLLGPGTYFVDVDLGTGCLATDTITIQSQPVVTVIGDTIVCAGTGVPICAIGNFASYQWTTGSTSPGITVYTGGVWTVTATDNLGCVSSDSLTVVALSTPVANFSFTVGGTGLTYSFTNGSSSSATWFWDFGDGWTSSQQNPSHTYAASGTYSVRLVASNACGSDTLLLPLTALGVGEQLPLDVTLSPQPATDYLRLQARGLQSGDLEVTLTDLQGRQLRNWAFSDVGSGLDERLEMGIMPQGMYLLTLRRGDLATVRKVVVAQ